MKLDNTWIIIGLVAAALFFGHPSKDGPTPKPTGDVRTAMIGYWRLFGEACVEAADKTGVKEKELNDFLTDKQYAARMAAFETIDKELQAAAHPGDQEEFAEDKFDAKLREIAEITKTIK